jgi:YD repeat-containing protein
MKKLIYSILILGAIACKPDSATPEDPLAKECQIQQETGYDGGTYAYKYNASNQLNEMVFNYKDENNQPQNLTLKFEYNAAGNLAKVVNSEGYIDAYIYDNSGLLTRVDFFDPDNKIYEQFVVKMDAQKRITNILTKAEQLNCTYEYNGPGGLFSRSIVKAGNSNNIVDDYQVKSYETDKTRKRFNLAVKGHPFDPTLFTFDIIYSVPLNLNPANMLVTAAQATTQYDENYEKFTNTSRLTWDVTSKFTYNENGFPTQQVTEDKIANDKYTYTFAYTNCK